MFKAVRGAVNINYSRIPMLKTLREGQLTWTTDGHLMLKDAKGAVHINYWCTPYAYNCERDC
jgi:hypothetical protein